MASITLGALSRINVLKQLLLMNSLHRRVIDGDRISAAHGQVLLLLMVIVIYTH